MKLRDALQNVDYDELVKLYEDVSKGSEHVKKLVSKKLDELENSAKSCAVCGKPIFFGDGAYTLIFGNDDFKKKANLCAVDCLDFFVKHLKKLEEKKATFGIKNEPYVEK
ncbi:hypothetical protein JXM83_04005 [Candidatus Woesearchaeota archaeon]|nr:hypothetical protein [Candidatus Woesearchaeota archaeon]